MLECRNWWHNGCWVHCNDNMHVTFLKTPFELWFNAKIFHFHKHAFLQMLLMHINIRWFHPQSDCGQNCPIEQIIMQICIAWIFHAPICNSIKGVILNTFASNATFLIFNSKSSTTTSDLISFIGTLAIVPKKNEIPK